MPADTAPITEEPTEEQATTTVAQIIEELAAERGIPIVDKGELPVPTIDTSDWQTYRNEEFGFEVRYPQGLFVDVVWQPTGSTAVLFKEVPYDSKYSMALLNKLTMEESISNIERYKKDDSFGYKIFNNKDQSICSYYYLNNMQQWYKVYGCYDVPTEIFRSLDFLK